MPQAEALRHVLHHDPELIVPSFKVQMAGLKLGHLLFRLGKGPVEIQGLKTTRQELAAKTWNGD
jgi:hypothetical protein